METEDRR